MDELGGSVIFDAVMIFVVLGVGYFRPGRLPR